MAARFPWAKYAARPAAHAALWLLCLSLAQPLHALAAQGNPGGRAASAKKTPPRTNKHTKPASQARPARQAAAAPAKDSLNRQRDQLQNVQQQLKSLNRNLAQTEQQRRQTQQQLSSTVSAIKQSNRQLETLGEQRETTLAALHALQQQGRQLETQIHTQQERLGRILYHQLQHGEVDALRLLLSAQNTADIHRDLHYSTLLSQALTGLLHDLQHSKVANQRLSQQTTDQARQLADIENRQQQQRNLLVQQQQERQQLFNELTGKAQTQRLSIDRLKQDEQRLSQLIDRLVQQAAEQARAREAARLAAERKAVAARAARERAAGKAKPTGPAAASGSAAAPALMNEQEPRDLGYSGRFNQLKGKLHLPVRGQLKHRFGQPRAGSGANWKGIFIQTVVGSTVKAIAPGRVVFADALRGFGQLMIIDHGDDWLSVYGNNQTLVRHAGEIVRTGDSIATVGSEDDGLESGLYFELRQQGRAIDPLPWVSLK